MRRFLLRNENDETQPLGPVEFSIYVAEKETYTILTLGDFKGSDSDDVPLRIQAQCVPGDIFGSLHCDCRSQLDLASRILFRSGNRKGILIYVTGNLREQWGCYRDPSIRIINLPLSQTANLDNPLLSYDKIPEILSYFKIRSVILYSENPRKINIVKPYLRDSNSVRPLNGAITEYNRK
jgi:3,4-dihydroxy 2-butanone 4-phosphate synthase/GTP cyclohydrolase II